MCFLCLFGLFVRLRLRGIHFVVVVLAVFFVAFLLAFSDGRQVGQALQAVDDATFRFCHFCCDLNVFSFFRFSASSWRQTLKNRQIRWMIE